MNLVLFFWATLVLAGCYLANDHISDELRVGFNGRVEQLEDAFFSSNLAYSNVDFDENWQVSPWYQLRFSMSDTIMTYLITLADCKSAYYLANFEEDWNCDSSYIILKRFYCNKDSLSSKFVDSFFETKIVEPLRKSYQQTNNRYQWKVQRYTDSVLINVYNQHNEIRKRHYFSFDSISNLVVEKQTICYLGDSTIIYRTNPEQRYVYIKSRQVLRN